LALVIFGQALFHEAIAEDERLESGQETAIRV
jgi:hypothetical protein